MEAKLKRAQVQRLHGLINAMKTMDAFAICSLPPDMYSKYDDVKNELLRNYSDGITEDDLNDYTLDDVYDRLFPRAKRDKTINKLLTPR